MSHRDIFDEFWVNNGRTALQKLLLPVILLVSKIFKIRFLGVFQEFFTKISLGVLVFFFILKLVTVKRWKSERLVSKALLCWNILGRFLSIRPVHLSGLLSGSIYVYGLSGFLKHVDTFIKRFI